MNATATEPFDILGLGCAAVDDLLYVSSFPGPDTKSRVLQSVRRCGGLTGTALVAAARLGARCAYAGCLGTDEYSQHVANNFVNEGVDITHAPRLAEAKVVHSTIVVGQDCGSRNVFFEDKGIIGAHDSLPDEKVIRRSKVLFIDHSGMCGNLRAARIARSAGISVVADFEDDASPLFREVLGLVDHLLLSEEFALQTTRKSDASEAALALWRPDRVAVLVTCGAKGCWSVSAEAVGQAILHPAFTVSAIDTTGCGDVFHGAYSASLARGAGLSERIRFASAAAALRAKEGEIPRRSAVETFLVSHL